MSEIPKHAPVCKAAVPVILYDENATQIAWCRYRALRLALMNDVNLADCHAFMDLLDDAFSAFEKAFEAPAK